jgi:acyl-CoA dehydrogenase
MNFEHSSDNRRIIDAVGELVTRFNDAYWREHDEGHQFPWEFYAALAEGGWIGIAIPEQYGGGGQGITEAALVLEEIAASGAGMNGASSIHLSIFGMHPVVLHGSDVMKQRYLPDVATGKLHVCFGVTEPDAGSDTTRIRTVAKRDGDYYVITGRKVWTSKAQECTKVLLLTRTTPRDECTKPTQGMTLFLADLDKAACEIRPIRKMGRNAVDSNELLLDGLRVPVEDRVGEEGEGFRYLLDGLNPERILVAHEALGLGRVSLDRAVRYATERTVFERPIGQNQGIAFPLAQALAQLDAARLVAYQAAWRYDNGLPCGREANEAKYLCAEAGFFAADRAVQTLGGFGYANEYDVERYFREARMLRLAPVSQELILAYLSEHVLELPRSY